MPEDENADEETVDGEQMTAEQEGSGGGLGLLLGIVALVVMVLFGDRGNGGSGGADMV